MPTTLDLVKKAIAAMKDRTGSSTIAITKWIVENEKVEPKKHVLKAALTRGVSTGVLVKVKASYKLSPEAKKAPKKKKPAAKKAAPKKAAAKKTTTKKKASTKKATKPKAKTATKAKKATAKKPAKKATKAKKTKKQ